MSKRMAILVALVGMAGPAFGQGALVNGVDPIKGLEQASAAETADMGAADCEARYRSMRVRGDMKPSERRAALAICRTGVDAKALQQEIAKRSE